MFGLTTQVGPGSPMTAGGIMTAVGNDAIEKAKKTAEKNMQLPVMMGLAGHIRASWQTNKDAKDLVHDRILNGLRRRRGEYSPEKLALIRQQGGSEVFMMITASKCRGVSAWLRDILLSSGSDKAWELAPTSLPEMPPDQVSSLQDELKNTLTQMAMQGVAIDGAEIKRLIELRKHEMINELRSSARTKCEEMERYMEDQLSEGGFMKAMSQFIDDLTTFPAAIIKGPVVRRRRTLTWTQSQDGWSPKDVERLVPEWERVSPFDLFPAPQAEGVDDGDLIELHRLTRADLNAMLDVEGYSNDSITAVLDEYGSGGLIDWTSYDSTRADVEKKYSDGENKGKLIEALQFWGAVQGKMLLDWGMDEKDIADPVAEYEIEAWLIGNYVIKAIVNPDPLGRRPYFKTCYENLPGSFWGNAIPDLIEDAQDMCNAAARALGNNMSIASGPMAYVNVDRLPPGEDITSLYPWKIFQTASDPTGGSGPPVGFFQPNSNAQELMAIYEKFATLADEYSGVPRYMTGESPTGEVGRTASGLSMLMTHAGKIMKQVVANIDVEVLSPLLERLHGYNMRYSEDEIIKGDVKVVARGINSLMTKESAQVRRTEFLAATNNPVDTQILGLEGRAAVLREVAKALDMNVDRIVPDPEMLKARQEMMVLQQTANPAQPQLPASQGGAPAPTGMPNPQGNQQQLMDGAPIADNFSPKPLTP